MFRHLAAVAALSIAIITSAFAADGKTHHVAIQIDQNDPQIMNLVLNNATNIIEHYRDKHEDVDIDIVALIRYRLLWRAFQIARLLGLMPHVLNRIHHVGLLVDDRVAIGVCGRYPQRQH